MRNAMTIRLPRHITPYPDRDLDCQQALEDTFRHILKLAEASGWDKAEAAHALQELAFAHLAAEEENVRTTVAMIQAGLTKH
jgi:anti-sigma regulatory factor (Ser/Thr protein kinase)